MLNLDLHVALVDASGVAFGTVGNPLNAQITGAGSGGTSAVDEAAWTAGSSALTPGGGVFNDSAAALTSGQQGTLRMTPNRAQHANLRNQAGTEIATSSNPLRTDPTGTTSQGIKVPGTISSVNSSTATLLANAVFTGTSEDVSGVAVIEVSVLADQVSAAGGLSLQFSSNGTNWDFVQGVTIGASAGAAFAVCPCAQFFRVVYTNGAVNQGAFRLQTVYRPVAGVQSLATFQDVNAALSPTAISQRVAADLMIQDAADNVTSRIRCAKDLITGVGGSTLLGQAAGIYQTSDTKFYPWVGTQAAGGFVQGAAAAGAAVAGNPLRHGVDAVVHGANPTAVAAGQAAPTPANRHGVPFVIGGHPNIINVTRNFSAAQTDFALVANSAGTKIVVVGFLITASNANSVNVAAGIGLAQTVTPPSGTTNRFGSHPGVAAGSGFGRGNGAGIIAVGADGDQVLLTSGAATGGSIDVSCSYYTVPS